MASNSRQANSRQLRAAKFFHQLLTDTLDDLFEKVKGLEAHKHRKIKASLRNISEAYTQSLSDASSEKRPKYNDPANRCAYVFTYLMQHCNIVFSSLQKGKSQIVESWQDKVKLKVCSIGGGPGSDIVGLITFLREYKIFPKKLEFMVLDHYHDWEDTWKTLYNSIPEDFGVTYGRCDLVNDSELDGNARQSIKQADLVTLVKFFSAVAAFYRKNPSRGDLLRSVLGDLKRGCFVLYIDNVIGTLFKEAFATPAGLKLVLDVPEEYIQLPYIDRSDNITSFIDEFDRNPLRKCNVVIQLYRKM